MVLENSGVTKEQLEGYKGGEILARCLDQVKARAQKLKQSPERMSTIKSKVKQN
jgi:hypothetical protein